MKNKNANGTNGTNDANEEKILYKDLSYQILECAFEVHNILGPGFPEKIYEEALVRELRAKSIEYERQKLIEVFYKGEKIGDFRLDLVVESKIVLELKAISDLPKLFEMQVFSYLKATGLSLGIIINFGGKKVESRRIADSYSRNSQYSSHSR